MMKSPYSELPERILNRQEIPWTRVLVEGVVIAASILLAFAVDASWDAKQLANEREILLMTLEAELKETRGLLGAAISIQREADQRVHTFLLAADTLDRIPVDSLRALVYPAFQPVFFEPALREYQTTTRSMDRLGLSDIELMRALAVFERGLRYHRRLEDSFGDMNFLGPVYDLRMSLGSLYALTGPTEISGDLPRRFVLSEVQFRTVLDRTETFAAIESLRVVQSAKLRMLEQMEGAVTDALEALASP